MKIEKQVKLFNAELNRLKKLIPGIRCTEVYTCRTIPHSLVCIIETNELYIGEYTDNPKMVTRRLLTSYEYIVTQLNENIKALREIVDV